MRQKKFSNTIRFLSVEDNMHTIKNFCTDMTFLADKGYYDIPYERKDIIDKVIISLCRRSKSNVMLIGEPGVGKTAIVESLAFKIARNNVPFPLLNNKIVNLNLSKLIAGARYRGDLEERLDTIIGAMQKFPSLILFIDEIHNIFNTGLGQSNGLDIANIIKPVLAREQFHCIGATTSKEYNQFFLQKDTALARRFQNIYIDEMSKEETFNLMKTIKKDYEHFHLVKYDNSVLWTVIDLCDHYITNKQFPDKVIDVIDSIGSYVTNVSKNIVPVDIIKLIHQINVLKQNKIDSFNKLDITSAEQIIKKINDKKEKLNDMFIKFSLRRNVVNVSNNDLIDVFIKYTGLKIVKFRKWKNIQLLRTALEEVLDHEKIVDDLCKFFYSVLNSNKKKNFLCSLLFTGYPGTGKTHMIEILRDQFFSNEEDTYIGVDCDLSYYYDTEGLTKVINKIMEMSQGIVHFYNFSNKNLQAYKFICNFLSDFSHNSYVKNPNCLIVIFENNIFRDNYTTVGFSDSMGSSTYIFNDIINSFQWNNYDSLMSYLEKYFDKYFLSLLDRAFVFETVSLSAKKKIASSAIKKQIKKIEQLIPVKIVCDNGFFSDLNNIYNFKQISPKLILHRLDKDIFLKINDFLSQEQCINNNITVKLYFDKCKNVCFSIKK